MGSEMCIRDRSLIDWLGVYIPISLEKDFFGFLDWIADYFGTEFVHYLDNPRHDGYRTYWHTAESESGIKVAYSLPGEKGFVSQGLCHMTFSGSTLKSLSFSELIWLIVELKRTRNSKFNRIDVSCDLELRYGRRVMELMRQSLDKKDFTGFRKYKDVRGSDENKLAFGGRRSDRFTRIYDKALESNGENPVVRFEAELKHDYAEIFVFELIEIVSNSGNCLTHLKNVVFGAFDFVDRSKDKSNKNVDRCPRLDWWQTFIDSVNAAPVKISVPRRKSSFIRKMKWIERQVSTTFAQISEVMGEDFLLGFIQRMSESGRDRMTAMHRAQNRVQIQQNISDRRKKISGFPVNPSGLTFYISNSA